MAFQWWTTIAVALVAPPGLLPRRSAHFWGSPAPYERVRFPSSGLRLASRRTSRPSRHTSQRPPPRRSARAAARGRPQPADTRRHSAHSALLMADAGGAGISPDDEKYQSCFDLMKSRRIPIKKGAARGERACPNCWTAWQRNQSTCSTCTIKKLPARTSRRGQPAEFAYKPPPAKTDVNRAAAARSRTPPPPPKEVEKRSCSRCGDNCTQFRMKQDWDKPVKSRLCNKCKKGEESVRLKEEVHIKSGDNYSTSVEVPNATDGLRCKVVVEVTLKIVKDEREDAKQERARAAVLRKIKNSGRYHGKVVNVDGKNLGSSKIEVYVKRDDENDKLYVEKKHVLGALARTQNGTCQRPK